ncbi:heavy metal translocating P-type ATPase [uncultured Selenomonas sp.]|uniref:heavy metal translocating P-type ATPase n=1 Tax=uncultured Selenomonas sp. TaxID=159275 RepID=UPI0028F0328E|nr:heavy metal translocating P-type ATPase [uncultured Selenomonas sp.]
MLCGEGTAGTVLLLAAYVLVGADVLWRAAVNLRQGHLFGEHFLMSTATLGALALGDVAEAAAVMLLYQLGEFLQDRAVQRARRSIMALMDIRPDTARVLMDGREEVVHPEAVAVGSIIRIYPGERVPLDGTVTAGESTLDTAALTGESLPRAVRTGDTLLSGCVNITGALTVRVTAAYAQSAAARILDLVEEAADKKSRTEAFITRFARIYTPVVVCAALGIAVLPPLITGDAFAPWVYRALTFLVISCPCALVISVPLTFFAGLGAASRAGLLVKGSSYLDALARTDTVVFDKTGTLTEGKLRVTRILPAAGSAEQEVLAHAAAAEQHSSHPMARAVMRAFAECGKAPAAVHDIEEHAGCGITARSEERIICIGTRAYLSESGVTDLPPAAPAGAIWLAVDGAYAGMICVADTVRAGAADTVRALREHGIRETVMLTGDARPAAQRVAAAVGIDTVYAELLPQDKAAHLERLLTAEHAGRTLAYIGDGINDAPVLARADIGIAMGGIGADAAIEAADVVLMTDEPRRLVFLLALARRTVRIARENIALAIGIKAAVLLLGALGWVNLWAAIFADVGVTLLAVLNAIRAMRA